MFSASGLGKQGRRPPFELRLPRRDESTGSTVIPSWRSDVRLPLREDPWTLPVPGLKDRPSLEGAERSHSWLYIAFSFFFRTIDTIFRKV